jgi:hypothetical protein
MIFNWFKTAQKPLNFKIRLNEIIQAHFLWCLSNEIMMDYDTVSTNKKEIHI